MTLHITQKVNLLTLTCRNSMTMTAAAIKTKKKTAVYLPPHLIKVKEEPEEEEEQENT